MVFTPRNKNISWCPFPEHNLAIKCFNCCAITWMFMFFTPLPAIESCAQPHGDVPWPLITGWLWNSSHILSHALGLAKNN